MNQNADYLIIGASKLLQPPFNWRFHTGEDWIWGGMLGKYDSSHWGQDDTMTQLTSHYNGQMYPNNKIN